MEQLVHLDQDGVELRSDPTPATRRTRATAHRRGSPCAYARGPSTRSHDRTTARPRQCRLGATPRASRCQPSRTPDLPGPHFNRTHYPEVGQFEVPGHVRNSPEAAPRMVQSIMPGAAQPLASLVAETTQRAEGIVGLSHVTRR